jgi:hypothetical protein
MSKSISKSMSKSNNRKILDIDTDSSFEVYNDKTNNKDTKNIKDNKEKDTKEPKNIPNAIKNSNYVRPEITYTDKLSKKDIEALLIDYEKVESLKDVPVGTYIRYFEDKDGVMKFRTGGVLTIKTGLPEYCILYNNKVSWSVQIKRCVFFRKITTEEIKKEYNLLIDDKNKRIAELQAYIKELLKNNNILKEKIKDQRKIINQNNKPINNKPINNKPINNKPINNKTINNKPINNKPINNKPINNKPINNKPINNKPINNKPIKQ